MKRNKREKIDFFIDYVLNYIDKLIKEKTQLLSQPITLIFFRQEKLIYKLIQ